MSDVDHGGERCELLSWDTRFWGFPVARLRGGELSVEESAHVLAWCRDRGVRCLFFAANGSCGRTLDAAARAGFAFVDVRLDLEQSQPPPTHPVAFVCTRAEADRLEHLEQMARVSYDDTRFFKDSRFDRRRAAEMYARWIARDLREQVVFLAHERGPESPPLGSISCQMEGPREGRIGLIAVAAAARGRGVGRALVDAALRFFSDRSVDHVRVATQATNVAAVRLYESAGFRTRETRIWFHRWFDPT